MEIPKAGDEKEIMSFFGKILFEQNFLYPNNKIRKFTLLKTITYPVMIFPITKDGKVIAISQFRQAANQCVIELPGGNSKNPQEIPEEIARKELLEETGFQIGKLINLMPQGFWFEPCFLRVTYIPILAMDCEFVKPQELDETEIIEVKQYPLEIWLRMIQAGEIRDSKSVAVTFLALPHLGIKFDLPGVFRER